MGLVGISKFIQYCYGFQENLCSTLHCKGGGEKPWELDFNEAIMYKAKEPPQGKTNKMSCVPNIDSDLPSTCTV